MIIKRYTLIICFIGTYCLYGISQRKCDLILQPLWEEIQDTKEGTIIFKGKWIRVGTITFRKKILNAIELNTITLHWHGPHIETLDASMYYTEINKPFRAIDNNWISDGQWSLSSQRLTFKFKSPCSLCAITTFHLVLTVPQTLEPILKQGYFTLSPCSLPQEYKDIDQDSLKLSFCTPFQSPVS